MSLCIFTAAVQVEKTSTVAMVRATNIPISFVLQTAFVVQPEALQWVGACLVFGSILMSNFDIEGCVKGMCCREDKEVYDEKTKSEGNVIEIIIDAEHSAKKHKA